MLGFLAKVATYVWKYGAKTIKAVSSWIRKNWKTVLKWINAGLSTPAIIELIMKILGL